ncbi:unnamed protein product [Paramecium primaurelia]|uniref:Uncharacterized protein n=1 Tax=Paramecium primaurelia TaxID=5886 RepID=A0A8S1QJY3_PARPR|nr:unnamed protein product [Paramecium primaurelia]
MSLSNNQVQFLLPMMVQLFSGLQLQFLISSIQLDQKDIQIKQLFQYYILFEINQLQADLMTNQQNFGQEEYIKSREISVQGEKDPCWFYFPSLQVPQKIYQYARMDIKLMYYNSHSLILAGNAI